MVGEIVPPAEPARRREAPEIKQIYHTSRRGRFGVDILCGAVTAPACKVAFVPLATRRPFVQDHASLSANARPHMPRFSANLGHLFVEYPLIERIGHAAKAGFKAIELQNPYDLAPSAVKAEIDRHGVTMLNLNSPPGPKGEAGLAAVAGREADFWVGFTTALDYIVAIGGNSLHVLSGVVPPNERPAAERVIIANLTRACEAAAAKNIYLMLEPLNQRDRPDYYVSHIEHIADIIAKVGKPNLKVMYDFYHVQVMQGDVLKRMEKHLPIVGHVQFAGPPTRLPPHKGELNFPIIFDAVDAMGWTGWVGAEYGPGGPTLDSLVWGKPYGIG
jgi:hydroxypyruvate isomerase